MLRGVELYRRLTRMKFIDNLKKGEKRGKRYKKMLVCNDKIVFFFDGILLNIEKMRCFF